MTVCKREHHLQSFVSFLVHRPKGIHLLQISLLLFLVSCENVLEKKLQISSLNFFTLPSLTSSDLVFVISVTYNHSPDADPVRI